MSEIRYCARRSISTPNIDASRQINIINIQRDHGIAIPLRLARHIDSSSISEMSNEDLRHQWILQIVRRINSSSFSGTTLESRRDQMIDWWKEYLSVFKNISRLITFVEMIEHEQFNTATPDNPNFWIKLLATIECTWLMMDESSLNNQIADGIYLLRDLIREKVNKMER